MQWQWHRAIKAFKNAFFRLDSCIHRFQNSTQIFVSVPGTVHFRYIDNEIIRDQFCSCCLAGAYFGHSDWLKQFAEL